MSPHAELLARARNLIAGYSQRGWTIATAESCTGGLVAALLTEVAGSSAVFERGFISYSNAAKHELLGVPQPLIEAEGAVSEAVARAMAEGARERSRTNAALSVTGIAGPGGATATKPVGLVHLALAVDGRPTRHRERRYGDLGRAVVRRRTVEDALALLEDALPPQPGATPR